MLPRVKEGILKFIAPIAQVKQSQRGNANDTPPEDFQRAEPPRVEAKQEKSENPEKKPQIEERPGTGLLGLSSALFQFSRKVLQKGRALTRYGRRSEESKSSDLERGRVIDENVD